MTKRHERRASVAALGAPAVLWGALSPQGLMLGLPQAQRAAQQPASPWGGPESF
jgi:hypothetical protein